MQPFRLPFWICVAACFGVLPSFADVATEQEGRYRRLPAGTEVSPVRALEGMALALGKTNPIGIAEQVPVTDHSEFEKSMRLVTRRTPAAAAGFQASARTVSPVKQGDLLLAVFWARAAGASDSAEASFVFETGSEPATRFVHYRFECEREWRRVFVPFLATADVASGDAFIRFLAGYSPQVLEIGGLRVASYGKAIAFSDLPYTPLAYKGRRAESPWRAEAAASVEKERKATFTIVVRNSRGKVVPWTDVRIRQLQHAYGFGAKISPSVLLEDSDDGDAYRWRALELINQGDVSDGLDLGAPAETREAALDAFQWLRDYDLGTRSQALFAADGRLPASLAAFREQKSELRTRVLEHTREKVGAAKGLVSEWSVPVTLAAESELGIGLVADLLRAAREVDPQAKLVLHAGNVLADGVEAAQQNAVIQSIRALLETKAPIHGIALGSHFGEQLLSPDRIWGILSRFGELRLPLSVVDFEIDTWDEEAQADYTRDFATTVFAHPATVSCSLAGLLGKGHPLPNAALFTQDGKERPNARAWQALLSKKWWSSTTISTNGKGVVKTKAYLGYYAIEIRGGDKPKVVYAKLTKAGKWLEISMPSANAK